MSSTSAKASSRLEALSSQLSPTIINDTTGSQTKKPSSSPSSKVIIITGTNSPLGIGLASAHQFASSIPNPHAIFLCDYLSTHLESHAQDLRKKYPSTDFHIRCFDAADEERVKGVVEEAVSRYGRLDVMVANAGVVGSNKVFGDIDAQEFIRTMGVNVLSVFLATKFASKAMQKTSAAKTKPSGSIIATASVAGIRSNAGSTDYSASKAAVISLMQTTAYQLAGTGIRCNAVCPGLIETGMTGLMFDAARRKGTEGKIGQLNPMRRAGVAEEVARVVAFLGSEDSSYVNGQAWAVDGGLSAGHPFVPGKLA
ncbi:MAG: hypothetical protein Q9220_001652 [cf. Caloplaca sp. 1 TL-2023]